jgi:hypothetical protein
MPGRSARLYVCCVSPNEALKEEWLGVSEALAIKDGADRAIPIEDLFNQVPFENGIAVAGDFAIERKGVDSYLVSCQGGDVYVDLNQDIEVTPPYPVPIDYVPGGLTKLGIEVLGGASGFATEEPCSGLALCYNGDYLLIDSIPFLDQHLFARGISKNQVSTIFLTHLHDDHCAMFPLMEMPHRVEVITTLEIFNMAMEKLSCGLGWSVDTVREHFDLIKVEPGDTINYYGLKIEIHNTVHSIPTIGATFSTIHKGQFRDVCIVGDNQPRATIHAQFSPANCRWRRRRNPWRSKRRAAIKRRPRCVRSCRRSAASAANNFFSRQCR